MIGVFNDAVRAGLTEATLSPELRSERLFKWTDRDYRRLESGRSYDPATDIEVLDGLYRPFHSRLVNAAPALVNRSSLARRLYPDRAANTLAICVPPPGSMAPPFAALMTSRVIDSGLYASSATLMLAHRVFDAPGSVNEQSPGLFAPEPGWQHNITDHALAIYRSLDPAIEKDDIFFYVYGILHSPDYRTAFAADLKKSLPRIPQVATAEDFWAFSTAGRELSMLHTDYEDVEVWPDLSVVTADGFDPAAPDAYRVTKMKHPKVTDPATGAKVDERTRIIYNERITIEGIPEEAYGYELGSRSAIGWVMEAWRIKTDKASGITNDPNDWATEHDDPTYILDLVGRVVTVSMRTLAIVSTLPRLEL
jgi:predicted helicase